MADDDIAVTVDMIRPYLTDRGTVEIDLAVERLRNRLLSIELQDRRNGDSSELA
jgi:hypothetical protein